MPSTTNPFDDPHVAARYEGWYAGHGRRADRLEKRLINGLLDDFRNARTLLDVGCGTGHFSRWLAAQGYLVVGLDVSEAMLSEAHLRNSVRYVLGDAEAIPFDDKAFDVTMLVTTLEFVADPRRVLQEAVRVSTRGLLLGVLNRQSLLAVRRRRSGKPPWDEARFFSPAELVQLVREASGERLQSIRWRTTLWPFPIPWSLSLPWGGFIGVAAILRETPFISAGLTE